MQDISQVNFNLKKDPLETPLHLTQRKVPSAED